MCVIDKSGNRIEVIFEAVIPKLNQRHSNHINPNRCNARFPSTIYNFEAKKENLCILQFVFTNEFVTISHLYMIQLNAK